MRKYLMNGSLLSAIAGGWSVYQTSKEGPRDWRLVLMWISWGITVAIAIGTIAKEAQESYELEK